MSAAYDKLALRHVCGLMGFGLHPDDGCDACRAATISALARAALSLTEPTP